MRELAIGRLLKREQIPVCWRKSHAEVFGPPLRSQTMSGNRFAGLILIILGAGLVGWWAKRSFFHPTTADQQYINNLADGGAPALIGNPPASILLLAAVAAFDFGQHLLKK